MSFMNDATDSAHSYFTPIQQKVFKILESNSDTAQGISIQAILKDFQPKQHNEVKYEHC